MPAIHFFSPSLIPKLIQFHGSLPTVQAIKEDPFEEFKPLIAGVELPRFNTPLGSAAIGDQTTLLLTHNNASLPALVFEAPPSPSELSQVYTDSEITHLLEGMGMVFDFDVDVDFTLPSNLLELPMPHLPHVPLQQQQLEQQTRPEPLGPFGVMGAVVAFPEVPVPMPAQPLDGEGFEEAVEEREQLRDYKLKEAEEERFAEELGHMLIGKRNRFPLTMRACAEATGKMLAYGFNDSTRTSAAGRPSKHDHLTKTGVRVLFRERGNLKADKAAAKATAMHRCGRSAQVFKGLREKTLRQRCL